MKRMTALAGVALLALSAGAIAQSTDTTTGADAGTSATAAGGATGTTSDMSTSPSTDPSSGTASDPAASTATGTEATTQTTGTTDTSATSGTDAATSASGTTGSMASDAAATAASGAASSAVQSQWATYDKDSSGALTPLEFGTWIMAAQGNDMSRQVERTRQSKASNLPAVKVLNATAAEFSKADKDHDRMVSQSELTTYLSA